MQKNIIITPKFLTLVFFILLSIHCDATTSEIWQPIAAGIEYQKLESNSFIPWSGIHVLRVDLKKNNLSLKTAKSIHLPKAFAKEYAEKSHALIAINGGFFDDNHQPLGLRIDHQQQLSPLKRISWWGVFYLRHKKAYIQSLSSFHLKKDIDLAIQSGPRLLVDHQIPRHLKPGHAERSAIGITADGRLILLVTEHSLITTTELAGIMQRPPLNCVYALNLDGGRSSQLSIHSPHFSLEVPGISQVSDALVINPI